MQDFQKRVLNQLPKPYGTLGLQYDWEEQTFDFLDHWVDVFQNDTKPDVKRVYQNADAVVDLPGLFFYEEILEAFPDCKVILSVREEDSWLQSWTRQLESLLTGRSVFVAMLSPTVRKLRCILDPYVYAILGACNLKSTSVFIKRYRIHNQRVKSTVPADKLLVYNVKQGWKPLCDFLEYKVPTVAFPHENIKAEITMTFPITRIGQQVHKEVQRGAFAMGSVLAIIVITAALIRVAWNK